MFQMKIILKHSYKKFLVYAFLNENIFEDGDLDKNFIMEEMHLSVHGKNRPCFVLFHVER